MCKRPRPSRPSPLCSEWQPLVPQWCETASSNWVSSDQIVPGDVLLLAEGDAVAADARLVEAASLMIAEASLTGESEAASSAPWSPENSLLDLTGFNPHQIDPPIERVRSGLAATKWSFAVTMLPLAITSSTTSTRKELVLNSVNLSRYGNTFSLPR